MKCADYDTAFKAAEQQISRDMIKKKYKFPQNAYWGRVPDGGNFPRNSGLSIKKIRLTRIGYGGMEVGWQNVSDDGCTTTLCAQQDRETMYRGWSDSYYSIERFGIKTDDICLALLPFREMPEEELNHFEEHLRKAGQYFWNEYARSRQIHLSDNKFVCIAPAAAVDSSGCCDLLNKVCVPDVRTEGFVFWRRNPASDSTPTGSGPIDERYVSVNVHPDQISRITELSCDLLDIAQQRLELEDENIPFASEGNHLLDVVLGHSRIGTRLSYLEDEQMNNVLVYGGAKQELLRRLGTKKVFRDQYSVRYDNSAPRFYPDTTYNTDTLPDFGAYNPANPETWPRFVRVFPYVPEFNANGTIKYVVNPAYINAPFCINVVFSPLVFRIQGWPETKSVGSATVGETYRKYAGQVVWINEYDKTCNPRRETGHWELDFGAAAEPHLTENGYVYFSRVDHSIAVSLSTCTIPNTPCVDFGISPYCANSLTEAESALGITVNGRGANPVNVNASRAFYL